LHSALRTGDATSLALLAEIDIASGLYAEALNTLKSAAAMRPNDRVTRSELARLEELMKEKP
jgi:Flp pilus assembly protein TadD